MKPGEYEVVRDKHGINRLLCCLCPASNRHGEYRIEHMKGTDRSGHPRYNRMRAAMLRHLRNVHGPASKR